MENFRAFEKWYSKHMIKHVKTKLEVNIKNMPDYSWKLSISFPPDLYGPEKRVFENEHHSNYNFYMFNAENGLFEASCDFTKLDFILGKFLECIGELNLKHIEADYFLRPEVQDFIFNNQENNHVFLHYTPDEKTAQEIVKEGLHFTAFDKTTVKTYKDFVNINYNHQLRKPFGKYIIVIGINFALYDKYLKLINAAENKYLKVEEVLSSEKSYNQELDEEVYTLHPKFIKGYLNYQTGELVENPAFDSSFDCEMFLNRI